MFKKILLGLTFLFLCTGCSTTVAVVDTTASTVVYTGEAVVKTAVNIVDAITPDILNDN